MRVLVGEPVGAEDIAQEAFVRAWRHAAAYDARRGSVATWLLTITRNLALDGLRARRVDVIDPDVLVARSAPSRDPLPDERAGTNDDTMRALRVVRELPHEQRRALLLAALLGWSAREIAEADGVPLGTVKTRIRAGMSKLRAAMAERP